MNFPFNIGLPVNPSLKKAAINLILIVTTAVAALAIGTQIPGLIKKSRGPYKTADYSLHVAQLPYKLTLYGTTTCPHCATARQFLKSQGIQFNDLVIDQSKAAADGYKQLGEVAVPVLVSQNKLVVGFNQRAYAELGQANGR